MFELCDGAWTQLSTPTSSMETQSRVSAHSEVSLLRLSRTPNPYSRVASSLASGDAFLAFVTCVLVCNGA